MSNTDFYLLPTAIGSMPHLNADEACSLILKHLKDIPAWPQLPNRSPEEGMIRQMGHGFPAISVEDSNLLVKSAGLENGLEELYSAYLANDLSHYTMTEDEASGLYTLCGMTNPPFNAVKGQLAGPITFGLAVKDESDRPIIYDSTLSDAVAIFLRLKACWQEAFMTHLGKTIIFLDEPGMASYGSAFFNLDSHRIKALINEVLGGLKGLKGVHCCANTDWTILLETNIDIISFDSYHFPEALNLYPETVKKFLTRGGAIAWGIVPSDEESLEKEKVSSLKDRLEETMAQLSRKGIPFEELVKRGLITPSCGLAMLSIEASEYALATLSQLSEAMRRCYS